MLDGLHKTSQLGGPPVNTHPTMLDGLHKTSQFEESPVDTQSREILRPVGKRATAPRLSAPVPARRRVLSGRAASAVPQPNSADSPQWI